MANQKKFKPIAFRVLALVLWGVAAIAFFAGHDVVVHSLAMILVLFSVSLIQRSRMSVETPEVRDIRRAWALKPWQWLVGVALVVPMVVSLALMYRSVLNGYTGSAFPIYAFAMSSLLCGGWWSALFARWWQGPRI